MRINWFGPLTPYRSPVAQYSEWLLPLLAARAEVCVWTEQPDCEPPSGVQVQRLDIERIPWEIINQAELSIYHFHGREIQPAAWEISRLHPGLVVLHAESLHPYIEARYRAWRDEEGYVRCLAGEYGLALAGQAREAWCGRLSMPEVYHRFPFSNLACRKAIAVLAHHEHCLEELTCPGRRCVLQKYLPYAQDGSLDYMEEFWGFASLAKKQLIAPLCFELADCVSDCVRPWIGEMDRARMVSVLGGIIQDLVSPCRA